LQENDLKVHPLKNVSSFRNKNVEESIEEAQPVILMRAKGNPGIFVEVTFK
jgi:hypothetical protein